MDFFMALRDHGWPSPEQGLVLWHDLCAGRASATAAFIVAYLAPLQAWVSAKFSPIDPDLRADATHDLLSKFVKQPGLYHPAKGRLAAYLRMAVRGDLLNLLKKKQREQQLFSAVDVAELEAERNDLEEEVLSFDDPRLQNVLANLNEEEQRVFDLMKEDEHKTAAFAAVLGITHLEIDEQRLAVKNAKDRLMKRLQRAVKGSA